MHAWGVRIKTGRRVTRRDSGKKYALIMRSVAACWIGGYESKGKHLCSAWCPITNLLAIGARRRRRDHGAPVVILWEPSIPDEHFELCLESPGEEKLLQFYVSAIYRTGRQGIGIQKDGVIGSPVSFS